MHVPGLKTMHSITTRAVCPGRTGPPAPIRERKEQTEKHPAGMPWSISKGSRLAGQDNGILPHFAVGCCHRWAERGDYTGAAVGLLYAQLL